MGVSEETTTGVHILYIMEKNKTLLFPSINVNDSVNRQRLTTFTDASIIYLMVSSTAIMVAGKKAAMEGFLVLPLEDIVRWTYMFITTTYNKKFSWLVQ